MILIVSPAFAEEPAPQPEEKPSYQIQTGFGFSSISVNEVVYNDAGNSRLSHLIWKAKIPVATLGARYALPNDWTLRGDLTFSFGGDADMTDYDWRDPYAADTGHDQWTDRSQHPNTELQRYFDLELALGRNFPLHDATTINLNGGLKYTKVDLNARGGSYISSDESFRDEQGVIPHDLTVISYKQWHRTVFAGTEILHDAGNWQFSGLLRAGISIEPRDVDNHWLRDLRYDESFDSAPFAQIRIGAKRQLENGVSIFADASYQKYFEERGDTQISDTATGEIENLNNLAGADMSVTTINVGVSRDF